MIDLEHIEKVLNGRFYIEYTAFLDSNYNGTVLLPADTISNWVFVDSVEPAGFNRLIQQVIEALIMIAILGIFSLFSIFIILKIIQVMLN